MSTDNVTPIKAGNGSNQPPRPTSPAKKPRKPKCVAILESEEWEGFSTYEVIAGLKGVTDALEGLEFISDMDLDLVHRLAIAAKVLSSIVHGRAVDAGM